MLFKGHINDQLDVSTGDSYWGKPPLDEHVILLMLATRWHYSFFFRACAISYQERA